MLLPVVPAPIDLVNIYMFSPSLSKKEVEKRQNIFLSLSKDLKETIFSAQTADKLYNISYGKYKLGSEQQRIISFTTGEALLGIIRLNEFANILKERLEIDQMVADRISQDIKQEIFSPVMPILTKIQQESSPKPIPTSPSTPPSLTPPRPENENIVDLKNLPKP
jgi:hypothetical protein